jgi:hypothetical protein
MKTIPISAFACGEVRSLLDAFIDNELLVETSLDIIRHTSRCHYCETLVRDATLLKLRVKSAVQEIDAPAHLRRNLSRLIRSATVN